METMKTLAKKAIPKYRAEQIGKAELTLVLSTGCTSLVGPAAFDSYRPAAVQNQTFLQRFTQKTQKAFNLSL